MRFPVTSPGPRCRKVPVVAATAVVVMVAVATLAAPAVAKGPDRTLCREDTSRVTIPADFTLDACFDGSVLTLKNRTGFVLQVHGQGDIIRAIRNADAPDTAAILTTLITTDNMLPPGSYLQLWLGPGQTDIRIDVPKEANRKYALYKLLVSFLPSRPGMVAGVWDALMEAIESIDTAFANWRKCADAAANWLGDLGCTAGATGNVAWALGRMAAKFGVNAVPGELLQALINLDWAGYEELGAARDATEIGRSNPTLRIPALPPSPVKTTPEGAPTLPAEPTSPTLASATTNSVVLTWGDASNNEDRFVTQYKTGGGSWVAGPSVPADVTTVTISNLQPGTSYTFQVGAQNAAGTKWSAYATGATAAPPGDYHGGFTATVDRHAATGLSGHKGPGDQYARGPTYPIGTPIHIYCYVDGQSITNSHYRYTTTIWNLSDDGYWYTDAWLYTGVNGAVVPRCGGFSATVDSHAVTGLSGHKGPGDQYASGPTYPKGTTIRIYCYVDGQSITNSHYSYTTTTWNLSDDGYWYTDAWLYTGKNQPVVPRCR
jgi:Fibronectin type III domain.